MKKYNITVNGTTYEVVVEEVGAVAGYAPSYTPAVAQKTTTKTSPAPANFAGTQVTAPMPGTILDIKVTVGQAVKKGDVLCVLEAMKMENDIPSPCDGVVASVQVQKGSNVASGDTIITIN